MVGVAKHLTDKDKKKVMRDYSENQNMSETARINNTTPTTVKRIIEANPQTLKKIEHKKEQNTIDVLNHLESKKNKIKSIVDKYLECADDDSRIKNSSLQTLFTVYGIILDKELKLEELRLKREELEGNNKADTGLIEAFTDVIKKGNTNEK